MDASAYFRGKRITVMGLGLLGGAGDIRYLAEQGAELIITDLKSAEDAAPTLETLKAFPNIRYTLGRHELTDFRDRDLVIKAPDAPLGSPYIAEAKKHGIPVTLWAALFSRFARQAGATIVGVTGTRGKTTTTSFIVEIARAHGTQVIEGGNIRGTSMLPRLPELTADTLVILELDSWKLQGFREEALSPDVAVFTTFYPDHLNYYKGDIGAYLADKASIFRYQDEGDTLILGAQCAPLIIERFGEGIASRIVVADAFALPDTWRLRIPGEHNRYNAALALAAARALGIPDETSRQAIEGFGGVPGRLELVREADGIRFYNDTTSTTPEATLAALAALDPARTILITGGADKSLAMDVLLAHLPGVKRVCALAGTGTDRIRGDLPPGTVVYGSLKEAFEAARAAAVPGDAILLSPAFASFGMFKNEYDRGDQFDALVNAL